MKIRNILVVFAVVLMLVFSGCSIGSDTKQSGLSIGKGSASSGKGGVDLSFAEGNPSKTLNKDQPVNFAFVFTNYQNHPVDDLKMKIKGVEWGYVKGLKEDYSLREIPKATQTGPGVYSGLVEQGVKITDFIESYNFNPKFEYCYSAITEFRKSVCVPAKNTNTCDKSVENALSQNGPVKVSIDRINAIDNKIRIDFTLSDSGLGSVVNECFKTDDYANEYKIESVTLGTKNGNCKAMSGEKMINGQSNFYCEFDRSSDEAYSSHVNVELSYKYQQDESLSINVQDLNAGYN